MNWVWSGNVHQAEPREEENTWQEQLEHRAEILAVLGTGTCCIGKNSHQPPSTLSCFSLLQSASSTIPMPVWVLMPFTVKHHQPSAERLSEYVFPHHEEYGFSPTLPLSPPSIYILALDSLADIYSIQCVLSTRCCSYLCPAAKIPALLYLSPQEPINSEHPAFSWVHSQLFNNTTPYFK